MKTYIIAIAALGALLATAPGARADYFCVSATNSVPSGNVNVPDNASCALNGATVSGNVTVGQGSTLVVNGGTISGNVQGNNCKIVDLYGSPSVPLVVGGNVQIGNCTGASGVSGQSGPVTVGGDFQCHNNTAMCTAYAAVIGGNVQVMNNTSPGAPANISLNTIAKNLQCGSNVPPPRPYQGPNTVAGNKEGQCAAALGF
jgi:hypothetical protein